MSLQMQRRTFLITGSRAILSASLASVLGCSGTSQRATTATTSAGLKGFGDDLESRIPQLMAEAAVPGLSIALIRQAEVVWRRGFGVCGAASTRPVDSDTIFEAQSMSKPVFAYAVLKLCETGVLSLDTPLTKYTSERVVVNDPRLDFITPRHVLSHSSGFQNWRSVAEPLSIQFMPGKRWLYSGEAYAYLQSVVTRLTGHMNPRFARRMKPTYGCARPTSMTT